MLSQIKDFITRIVSVTRSHPILMIVALVTVGVFLASPALVVYRKVRALPVADKMLPAK